MSKMSTNLFLYTPSLLNFSSRLPKLNLQKVNAKLSLESSSNPRIWVNPNSPKARRLYKSSNTSRHSVLADLAVALNSTDLTLTEILNVLKPVKDTLREQGVVVLLNNMTNSANALILLNHFRATLRHVNHEVVLYNVTLKVFRKSKDLVGAERLFSEMVRNNVAPDQVTFRTLITCARVCNVPEKAVEFFEAMKGFGVEADEDTSLAMIQVYGEIGNGEMTIGLYDRARTEKWKIDHYTFSALIWFYSNSGNFDGCLNVYQEMKAIGVRPNLVSYNVLLDAMGRAKRPWMVKKIYKEMVECGIEGDWFTSAALLRAFCKCRYGKDAFRVYKAMREKGLKMSVVLCNVFLSMCASVGIVEEAIEVYNDMRNGTACAPDSWTFSSMISVYAGVGKASEAEMVLGEMVEAGFERNLFVWTSMIRCYGKVGRIDDVVKTFDQVLESEITRDDRFFGSLLSVLTQTPKEEVGKVVGCIEKVNMKLGSVVKLLIEKQDFKNEALELFGSISDDVKKFYCNCLIDICVNLDLLDKGCELLDIGLSLEIYDDIKSRSPTLWSLHLKGLSPGAAQTALHVWTNELSKSLADGEELPPLLGIDTGHGKHNYSDKSLAGVINLRLKELNAPFRYSSDQVGWFMSTKDAAKSWLEGRSSAELVAA